MGAMQERVEGTTGRVARLRRKLLAMDDASLFYERTMLCAEGWQEYQWEPPPIQTAKIFAHVLARMSLVIDEDDLLVGRIAQIVPDQAQEKRLAELDHFGGTLGQWALPARCEHWSTSRSRSRIRLKGTTGSPRCHPQCAWHW